MAKRFEGKEQEELSYDDVSYVLKFADALNGLGAYAISPLVLNQRLRDISMNQVQATETTLTNALNDVKNSETILQQFAQDFEIQSMPYKRLLAYLGNMLAFDLTYTCDNISKESDYKSAKYRKDLDEVKRFFDRFDYREEFSNVVKQLLRNEAFFSCPRFDFEQIILQELPSSPEYTLITGKWSYGLLFSFNMNWFLQGDISMYPDFFIEKFNEVYDGNRMFKVNYNPSINPKRRGNSRWGYWQDIPPDVGWVWKMNPTLYTRVPYFAGLFLDLILQPLMRNLQKNANMAAAAKMLYGEVPLIKDNVTKKRDAFALSPETLGKFMAVVKAAVGDSIKVASAPLANSQAVDFSVEEKLYSSYMKGTLANSGLNTNLFYSGEQKPNSTETQLSLNTDEQLMCSLYPQFEKFLNYQVNKFTKNFKFSFRFEGTNFFNNRQVRYDFQQQLVDKGVVMPQKIGASIGMNPFEMERQMEEAKAKGWVDNLTPIVPGFQLSGDQAGRPSKPVNKLSDSGEQTRADDGNVNKS